MLKLAVIGKDVSQSLSPVMHAFLLGEMGVDCSYDKISIPPAAFPARIEELFARYDGFNVTIPFKGDIVPYLKKLRGDAESFHAVNTVLCRERLGESTDGYGFLLMLKNAGVELAGKRALVLGVGGAGKSCIVNLAKSGADVYAYGRRFETAKAAFEETGGFTPLEAIPFEAFDIIVNCTGIGMHDTVGTLPAARWTDGSVSPVDERLLSLCDTAVDLIYVPKQSAFLRLAEALNKKTVNGEAMLFYQAYMADCIFTNREPNHAEAKSFYQKYLSIYGEERQ